MRLALLIACLCCMPLFGQQVLDENIQGLVSTYTEASQISCEITVNIQVEGMEIPEKTVLVDFEKGEKPKIKGKGLALLPKKGMINQFQELLKTPLQAIALGEENGNLLYKLVSLDEKSHWVTADIVFNKDNYRIYEAKVNTRKHGAFKAVHTYTNGKYPTESVITFNVKKFELPLQFIGRQSKLVEAPEIDEETEGKIILQYKYLE